MTDDEKSCPKCAETVKAGAVICKHCGYNFQTQASPENAAEYAKKKDGQKGKGCLIVLGVVVALGVLGSLMGGGTGGKATAPEQAAQAEQPLVVTARELESAYSANEAAAQKKYGGHLLQVTAVIKSIDLGLGDKPFLVVSGSNQFMGPQLHLSDASQAKASSLAKGQEITAICTSVSEVIGTPLLDGCDIQ
jgi:tRNA_anti-like/Uncharacterised protein family UPF0547